MYALRVEKSPFLLAATIAIAAAAATVACKGHGDASDSDAASTTDLNMADPDGGPVTVEKVEAGADDQPKIAALDLITPIFSATEFPARDPTKASEERQGVQRLGYLRKGQVVPIKGNVIKKNNCTEGWFELAEVPGGARGFVCGKYATTDLAHKELQTAPHAPYTDRPLPYDYGLNLTNGAPLYRRRPLKKERKDLERGLQVGKTKKNADGSTETAKEEVKNENGETPWYLKDNKGKRPDVKVDDLRTNEMGGLVVTRMVRGFYLALDKELSTMSGKFWRNTAGFLAPSDHILVHKSVTEFEGVRVGTEGEKRHLPLGFVVGPHVKRYAFEEGAEKKFKRGDHIDRFSIVQLTGKKQQWEDNTYYETEEGYWLRYVDIAVTRPGAPPKDLAPGEKWIDVNLTTQSLVAFEGDKPVYATIVSTGRHHDTDKTKDHRTVQGSFRIREKHVAATMEDDGGGDGVYSIQDVPWVMYFEGSYALHGAFWHSMFGREKSHGCVNMTPHDAKQIFAWVGPEIPSGWHGVKASKENPGTRVIVHADGPPPESATADKKDSEPKKDDAKKDDAKKESKKDDTKKDDSKKDDAKKESKKEDGKKDEPSKKDEPKKDESSKKDRGAPPHDDKKQAKSG